LFRGEECPPAKREAVELANNDQSAQDVNASASVRSFIPNFCESTPDIVTLG
jgi:hypothetical protein